MHRILIAGLVWLITIVSLPQHAVAGPSSSTVVAIPHIGNGGASGVRIKTTIVILNNGTGPATVQLSLTDDGGDPLVLSMRRNGADIGTVAESTLVVGPGQTLFVETDGAGDLQTGAARVTADRPVSASAIFTLLDDEGDFVSEAGVGAAAPAFEVIMPVDLSAGLSTGAAWFNPGEESAQLILELFDESGSRLGEAEELILAAGAHQALFVHEIFSGLADFRGTLKIRSDQAIVAIGLRQNASPLSFTTLPVIDTTSSQTEFHLPQVADGEFSVGRIQTTFIFFNPGESSSTVELSLTGDEGSPFEMALSNLGSGSEFELELGPRGSLFLESTGTGNLETGAAVARSSGPIGVAAIFTILDAAGRFQTEAGVGNSSPLEDLSIPVDLTASFNTGVALFNPGSDPVTVDFALMDSRDPLADVFRQSKQDRSPSSIARVVLPPLGHLARFTNEIFPSATELKGQLGMVATGPLAAMTLRQNLDPLTFTTLPVAEGALAPFLGDGWLLNEVGFVPFSPSESTWLELIPPIGGSVPVGLKLLNDAGDTFSLPTDLPEVPDGGTLMIIFDGEDRVEGTTIHADRTDFIGMSGFVLLTSRAGRELDRVAWGDAPGAVRMTRGGWVVESRPGMTVGRIPSSRSFSDRDSWVNYSAPESSPGSLNPAPLVRGLLPGSGAASETEAIELSWYPVAGAAGYRIQVGSGSDFGSPLFDQVVENPGVTVEDLTVGDYSWRVQVEFEDDSTSGFSPASTFEILGSPLAPRGAGGGLLVELPVPLISQHKDTEMLILESDRILGFHSWDRAHTELDISDRADNANCALASIAMLNGYYQGLLGPGEILSQDRIGYEIFKDVTSGPEWDLNWGRGFNSSQVEEALRFALNLGDGDPVQRGAVTDKEVFWSDIRNEIDNGRPMLLKLIPSPACAHALILVGYYQATNGQRYFLVNDPWFGPGVNNAPRVYTLESAVLRTRTIIESTGALEPIGGIAGYFMMNPQGPVESDEESLTMDSDRDGIVDFDEKFRFGTNWQDPDTGRDTDRDGTHDLFDIKYSVFADDPLAYSSLVRSLEASSASLSFFFRRVDRDGDGFDMELDPDSDGGGCGDGWEDTIPDGLISPGESSNFDSIDDDCHLQGIETIALDQQPLSPSGEITYTEDSITRFCLSPPIQLPAGSSPGWSYGRADVEWRARHHVQFDEINSFGCPNLQVTNEFMTVWYEADGDGSAVGPDLTGQGGASFAFIPDPIAVEATAVQTETPSCDGHTDTPFVWDVNRDMWPGLGWPGSVPRRRAIFVPFEGLMDTLVAPTTGGTLRSELRVWFVKRSGTEQSCSLP